MRSKVSLLLKLFLPIFFVAVSADALSYYFVSNITVTKRIGAVDSSAVTTIFSPFGNVADNQQITGDHSIDSSFGFPAAHRGYLFYGEYSGYIRAIAEEGSCYRARLTAFHVGGTAHDERGSFEVCFPFHSPDCGHCGPGTGMPCVEDVQGFPEEQ